MTRIWFNHWFRTAYSLVDLVKKSDIKNNYIIGSHSCENSPISTVCDEWYKEENLPQDEYVAFCIDFCREHDIDVFIPHRKMNDIAKEKARFEAIGVKLLSDDYKMLELFADKAKAYTFFKDDPIVNIPEFVVVNTADDFAAAYADLKSKYDSVCVKFVHDEGAQSFRRITADVDPFKALHRYAGWTITYSDLYAALATQNSFEDMMVMPYLGGCEVSVDCIKTDGGVVALPRYKGDAHIETLRFDEEILRMTNEILRKCDLQYPCDIQFRYLDGKPYLLEVNTRMSGGLPMTCAAAGINIPGLALDKLLGRGCPMPAYSLDERVFSNVELPIIIK